MQLDRQPQGPYFFALDHADPARRDGLAAGWTVDGPDQAVWMNPPCGRTAADGTTIGDWMAKAYETARAGRTVVTLVPVRSSSIWWHDYVLNSGAEVRYVKGRLTFGNATTTAAFASAVVICAEHEPDRQGNPLWTMSP